MNGKTYISHIAIDMPNVIDMKQTEAARLLESMGIDSHTIWPEIYNYDDPIVIYQSVPAGTPIKPWEEAVELHIR